MSNTHISAAILAGGEAKRLGGIIKSKILVKGEYLITGMIDILEKIFDDIIIITNTPEEFKKYKNCRTAGDLFLKRGPLGGIHAALHNSVTDAVFVFAGDMPFISREIVLDQIKKYKENCTDALVPLIGNDPEPLHAIYHVTILGVLTEYLREGSNNAVRDFLGRVNVSYMPIPDNDANRLSFTNINTPGDLIF